MRFMEIRITTKQILLVLNIITWIFFLGLCVEAGGIIFNAGYVLIKPAVAKYFWNGADLSALIARDQGQFITQIVLISIVALLKAILFYRILKLFYDKRFSLAKPFSPGLTRFVFTIAWLCLGAGFFSHWGARYDNWLEKNGTPMPDVDLLRIGGADVWLFMAIVLVVIGHVFKKGIELQNENDLTV